MGNKKGFFECFALVVHTHPHPFPQDGRVTHGVWILWFLAWGYYEFFNLFLDENTLPAEGKS
jgi:hypothetical protein